MPDSVTTANSDDRAVAAMDSVVQVHRNPTNWYNNASFALPLLAAIVVLVIGLVLRNGGALGFAGFLFVVTVLMVPVVLVSWRQTATSVVLTADGITSLHAGRVLKSLRWRGVRAVTRRETQGNVRWIVSADGDERIALDGELENLDRLIETARRLAGLGE
jgi:uncharacterized membrane protein